MASSQTTDKSIVDGSANPISSGAVYNAIQAIPAPLSTVYIGDAITLVNTDSWQKGSQGIFALVYGNVIWLSISLKTLKEIPLSNGNLQIGTLISTVKKPIAFAMLPVMEEPFKDSWITNGLLIIFINTSGDVVMRGRNSFNIPSGKELQASGTYLPNPFVP
jgi:hypothetical protein